MEAQLDTGTRSRTRLTECPATLSPPSTPAAAPAAGSVSALQAQVCPCGPRRGPCWGDRAVGGCGLEEAQPPHSSSPPVDRVAPAFSDTPEAGHSCCEQTPAFPTRLLVTLHRDYFDRVIGKLTDWPLSHICQTNRCKPSAPLVTADPGPTPTGATAPTESGTGGGRQNRSRPRGTSEKRVGLSNALSAPRSPFS